MAQYAPWKFINTQFIRPTARYSGPQLQRLVEIVMSLPAAVDPRFAPIGTVEPHNPAKWTPLNILGAGGFGVASLWRYNNPGHEYHNLHVVIKTAVKDRGESAMVKEGRIMYTLAGRNEEHLVNMIYTDQDFTKLYLEFCTGGDLYDELQRRRKAGKKMEEEEVWRLLLCLVRGADTMHKYQPTLVIHFDLKPENVLIQHDPVFHRCGDNLLYKLGDFGLATEKPVRLPALGTVEHARNVGTRGTSLYFSPEMFAWKNKDKGEPTVDIEDENEWELVYGLTPKLDIWAIGAIVWQFMVLTHLPPTNRYDLRCEGKDNGYFCPPNRFIPRGGQCFGEKIIQSGYSETLINIVQWCLMKSPMIRCSAEELLPNVEEYVEGFSGLNMQAARAGRVEEARQRAMGNAPDIIQASLATVEQRVQEELEQKRAERAAHRGELGHEPPAMQEQSPVDVYLPRLQQLLASQGKTREFYDKQRDKLSRDERIRLINAFLFLEGESPAWDKYVREREDQTRDLEIEDLILTYQMALEQTPEELERCFKAYTRRTDISYTKRTRMELVVRQRKFENTTAWQNYLLSQFEKRHRDRPGFMENDSNLAKMRVQRAFESQLPLQDQPRVRAMDDEERNRLVGALGNRILHAGPRHEFIARMIEAGHISGEFKTEAVNLQIAWQKQVDADAEAE